MSQSFCFWYDRKSEAHLFLPNNLSCNTYWSTTQPKFLVFLRLNRACKSSIWRRIIMSHRIIVGHIENLSS